MRVSQRALYYGLPFLAIIVLFVVWRGLYAQSSPSWSSLSEPFPTVNLPTLFDSEKHFTNQDLRGRVSLVNFWASWCAACQQEHPVLWWIKKNYPISIYGINFQDDPGEARAMLRRQGNPYYKVASDAMGSAALTLGMDVLPQTYLIDARGRIRYHHKGTLDKKLFEDTILPLIKQIENE